MNIFCVSHTFLPVVSAEAIQAARVLNQLNRMGHEVVVFTAALSSSDSIKEDELFSGEILRFSGSEFRLGMRVARRLFPALISVPDEFIFWYWTARKEALHAAKNFSADLIYSRSQPFTSALVGAWVARKLGIPHVASFSDPWVTNPFVHRGRVIANLNRRMEQRVVQDAAHVITTTQWLKNDLTDRYGESTAGKISVVPHSYDSDIFSTSERVGDAGDYKVSHIGSLYGVRSAVPLIIAANRLAAGGIIPKRFKIRLVGFIEKREAAAINDADHHGLVEMTGLVSYESSLVEMKEADLLLSIDGPGNASHPFLPSKIVEYIGTGNRILALTEKDSSSSVLAAELGALTARPADVDDIQEGLKRSIVAPAPTYTDGVTRKYSAEAVASNLNDILLDVVRSSS
jgi:hypothetical protein